ncbi:subtilisin-like protease SBT4.8 [Ziziphus jujuba]|uniref:Subtilisin-like protease SBT4.8 n=1 Tax=Ziziphus jujuba TaxID=326968 RepID=A0ABM3ZTL8_ZIZJJ|nr:subtilisin-like protease SBT4.8 [Ziziphus jujuba]
MGWHRVLLEEECPLPELPHIVCHPPLGCNDIDILAAFDDAIADGVDIISISIGLDSTDKFHEDTTAIGAFHAMKNGLLTVKSAENAGPGQGITVSLAPWLLSVAESSTDHRILDKVVLGDRNNTTLVGDFVNSFTLMAKSCLYIWKGCFNQCSSGSVGKYLDDVCLDSSLV